MKRIHIVIGIVFGLYLACSRPQKLPTQITQQTFADQVMQAFRNNDTTSVRALIHDHRYFTPPVVGSLVSKADAYFLADSLQQAKEKLDQAQRIAQLYNEIYDSETLITRVILHKGWSNKDRNLNAETDSVVNAGIQSAVHGDLQKAIDDWTHALDLFRRIGNEHSTALCTKNIGQANRYLGHYDTAMNYLNSARALAIKVENKNLEGETIREMGVVLHIIGKPKEALQNWLQALEIFQLTNNKDSEAITTTHIGVYYKAGGKPFKALEYYSKAVALAEETHNKSEKANSLNNMGNVYMDYLADYEEAINYFEQALRIKKELDELLLQGTIQENIGICYKNMGSYAEAFKHFSEAEKIYTKLDNQAERQKNLSEIGALYSDAGEYVKAIQYFQQSLDIAKKSPYALWEIQTLNNMATTFAKSGDPAQAEELYTLALQKAKSASAKGWQCDIENNLGSLATKQKHYARAKKWFDKSLSICRDINNIRQESSLYINYGELYLKTNSLAIAEEYFRKSLNIAEKIQSPENLWQSYFGIAKVNKKSGDLQRAVAYCDSAISHIESIRASIKSASLQESFTNEKFDVYETIIFLLFELGQEDKAFEYMEKSKARNLLEILSRNKAVIKKGISPEYLQRKQELEYVLSTLENKLADAYISNSNAGQNIEIIQDSLKNIRQRYNRLLEEIEMNHPKYSQLFRNKKEISLRDIQDKLPDETTLIEYLAGRDATLVWIIDVDNAFCKKIDIGRKAVDDMVTKLLKPFREVREGVIKNLSDVDYDITLSHKLYSTFIKPFEGNFENKNHLIIVPDAALYYLPFESLVTGMNDTPADNSILFDTFRHATYLVQKYSISYSPSALMLCNEPNKTTRKHGKLLAFGAPDFSQKERRSADDVDLFATRSARGFIFYPLRESEREVKQICKIMKPSDFYLHQNATEALFKKLASTSSFIHLSTHCVVDENQPLFSKIIFTQTADDAEDGFLHTYEIFNMQLDADLVTLSACETGLGKYNRGEGIDGLSRAFMYAGARSLLVSLWSIDEYSAELMTPFYKYLKQGMDKPHALRKAKIDLINMQKEGISFSHPFLWSPFILIGQLD